MHPDHLILLPDDRRADLVPLFAATQPAKTLLFSYLQGRVPGKAYVDDLVNPRRCVVVVDFHLVAFVGGAMSDVDALLAPVLEQVGSLDLVWDEQSGWNPPRRHLEFRFARLEFLELDPATLAAAETKSAGAVGTPSRLDDRWFERCDSREEHLLAYGSKERFFRHCSAFVLHEGDTYFSDASAIFSYTEAGTTWADLQVVTAATHRRRGYGLRVVGALMAALQAQGIRPVWSCHKGNAASWGLAQALGFHKPREFEILCLRTRAESESGATS